MITAVVPATNHKPDWVELKLDGAHMARIWAHQLEVKLETGVHQLMLIIAGANGVTDAFVWVDAVQARQEKTDGG